MKPALAGAVLIALAALAPPGAAQPAPRSGFEDMSEALRAMQRDDMQNPGLLAVAEGESLWQRLAGAAPQSCAGCHGKAAESMRGVAARHPVFDSASGQPLNLRQRINQCRVQHQQARPWPVEDPQALALESFVALQSRGLPLAPDSHPGLQPWAERGARVFNQRLGQLDLSCAQCHEQRAGLRLGGSLIPQGHPNGYPLYRLEWQAVGSLARRLRACLNGVRAMPLDADEPAHRALEVFLHRRAAGLTMESPALRP